MHYLNPSFNNYSFSYSEAWISFVSSENFTAPEKFIFVPAALFVFIAPFTGASHFTKLPLIKTIFTFTLIMGGYFLMGFLLIKATGADKYTTDRILFIKENNVVAFLAIFAMVINLLLLAISYFRLREREV